MADLRGGARYARPPGGPNSFNFMQFLGNFGKIVCWRPPLGSWRPLLGEILDPLLENIIFDKELGDVLLHVRRLCTIMNISNGGLAKIPTNIR